MDRRVWLRALLGLVPVGMLVSGIVQDWGALWAQTGPSGQPKKKSSKGGEAQSSRPKKADPEPEVHWPKDISRLQGLELDHVPLLEVLSPESKEDAVQLVIRVGQKLHVMSQAHYLRWVQVWVDDLKGCEMSLQPGNLLPKWQLSIHRKPSMQITIKTECNLHGVWANRLVL
jgi:desulfoferrodoxin-like iron-binding protein